ncbi:MAG TPA: thioredoxin family protein [Longimicrobium sp.]|nr:thioredoxin family protein [Longimicrobium sp.]
MKLMFFHAPWCGVCHEKAPVVDEIARTMALPLEVLDIEEEDGQTKAMGLRIKTVPTLALVDGDRVRFRLVGTMITPENVTHLAGVSLGTARPDDAPSA